MVLEVLRSSEAQSTKRLRKQVSNLHLQKEPGTGSFRPIVSSNRFKRLASVAVTVRLLRFLHCKSIFITKSQKKRAVLILVPAMEYSASTRARSKGTLWLTTSRSVSGPKGIKWAGEDSSSSHGVQAYHALEEAAMAMTSYG